MQAREKTQEKQEDAMTALPTPLHLLELWLHDLQADRADGTIKRYRGATLRFLSWYQQQEQHDLTLADLTPIALVSYRTDLQRAHAPSTVNTHVSALRAWCAWLTEHGYLTENPARRFKLVGRTDPLAPHSLSQKQVHALLRQAAKTHHPLRDLALVQLLLQTGMLIGECAALTWGDIRFQEKQGQVLIRRGKGNKARTVPLNTSARMALAGYVAPLLQVEPSLRAVARAWSSHPTGPLWISQKGGQLSVSAIGRVIDELVRGCLGLPREASAHWLRHTFATHYLATHPGDLVGLARLLGHTSLDTTSIYVQPTEEQLAQLVEGLDLNAYV
jgi:site-specific recombinase XerD